MKLTKTANTQIKPGMTLIEITVVILVLLTLISVLFIGANIYKKGADRAACILNIRNIHQAVRADQNLNNKNAADPDVTPPIAGDTLTRTDIIGTGKYLETEPKCPTDAAIYTLVGNYPKTGTVAATCANNSSATGLNHAPDSTEGW